MEVLLSVRLVVDPIEKPKGLDPTEIRRALADALDSELPTELYIDDVRGDECTYRIVNTRVTPVEPINA